MEKLNIAELLKDCPSGMELNCTMYEDVYFDYVDELQIIHCYIERKLCKTSITFNQYGTPNSHVKSKCVIFPKGKTTWDGFQMPFKDGDILAYDNRSASATIFIYRYDNDRWNTSYYVGFSGTTGHLYKKPIGALDAYNPNVRVATEEEKQKLFNAIKTNGYKWNAETKTLEKLIKPKFKVGDYVRKKGGVCDPILILEVKDDSYFFNAGYLVGFFGIKEQDDWELVPKKFDITTLKPFDKVLVRDSFSEPWNINYFSYIDSAKMFKTIMGTYLQCIPYEGNEHLLGSFTDCKDCYKTW